MKRIENESIYKDRYRILRKIGEGGSSLVYMAIDERSGQPVTIKMIKDGSFRGSDAELIVKEETKVIAYLDHPAIPKVVDIYDDSFVLEYIPGNSLERVMERYGRFSEKEAVKLAKELLDIFTYLHEMDTPVIYRDLKPANIIVRPDGHIALIDFGAARFYEKGKRSDASNIGTYGFAAPEQFGNLGQTDTRTDIYCFGKTISQLIKGRPSVELAEILEKCTMPDREDRFGSCRDIREAIMDYPKKVLRRRVIQNLKIAGLSAAAACIITFSFKNAETIKSYAAEDAEQRIPAVKERVGTAGLRIKGYFEERFGIDIDDEMVDTLAPVFGEMR